MHHGNNSSSTQQFPQQSAYQNQQVPVQQNGYQNAQQHQQLWTEQQQTNYQQTTNSNNGFNSSNVIKGTDINGASAFRATNSNNGNTVIPHANISQQATGPSFNSTPTAPTNQLGQQQNASRTANESWATVPQPNIGQNWQAMSENWQQTQQQSPLQTQTQPQQSSLQRTFDYVQQCQNWNSS